MRTVSVLTKAPVDHARAAPGERPRASQSVTLHEIDGEALVHDSQTGDTHWLNETALLVWRRCDGSHDVGQLADILAGAYDIPAMHAVEHVGRILQEFHDRRLIAGES